MAVTAVRTMGTKWPDCSAFDITAGPASMPRINTTESTSKIAIK